MAIIPDFKSSKLTLGPTFSTLLKLKDFPIDSIKSFLIFSIVSGLMSFFQI